MDYSSEILIIGGGVVGCAVARELSRYQVSVVLLEGGADLAEGASKANSGIVHAGYDAKPGTLKAKYNVEGAAMLPELCKALGVPYRQSGALVIGFSADDLQTLDNLKLRGEQNGVSDLRILSGEEARQLEPSLNPEVQWALEVPTSAIVSPYELTFAFADDAAINGVTFRLNTMVHSVHRTQDGSFVADCGSDRYTARILVNCAGSSSADIHNQLSDQKLRIVHRRGQYYLLDRPAVLPFQRTIFQCPSHLGKGVLVSPTVHGNMLLGPDAEDIADPTDTATTQDGLDFVLEKARLTWPALSTRTNITNFSGIRAHEVGDDFVVGPMAGCPGAYDAAGIESPGLSSSPAIARALADMISANFQLTRKDSVLPYSQPSTPFREMSPEQQAEAIGRDPRYGNIVCRCEVITEAEIVQAIHRPVGARSIDAIKRRTRAGMGRCQGGFCSPRVAAILSEETGIPLLDITKNGGNSYLLTGTLNAPAERNENV